MRGLLLVLCLALTYVSAEPEVVTFQMDIATAGDLASDDHEPLTCSAFVGDIKDGFTFAFNDVISDLQQELQGFDQQFQKMDPVEENTFVTCEDVPEGRVSTWMRIRGSCTGTLDAPDNEAVLTDALKWLRIYGAKKWIQYAKDRIGSPDPWDAVRFQYRKKKYLTECVPGFYETRRKLKLDGTVKIYQAGCPPEDLAWDPVTQVGKVFITS